MAVPRFGRFGTLAEQESGAPRPARFGQFGALVEDSEPVSPRERRRLEAIDRAVQRSRQATPEDIAQSQARIEGAYVAPISNAAQRAALLGPREREAQLGAQAIGSGLLSVPGSIVDLAEGVINLPYDATEFASGLLGADFSWPTERFRSHLGSQELKRLAAEGAGMLGSPVIPREQMSEHERMLSTAGEFAVGAPAFGTAAARIAPVASGAVRSPLQDIASYYQRAPGRAVAAEAAGGAAAGAAIESLEDGHPLLQFGGALGAGFLGAGAADVTLGGLPALASSIGRQVTPGAEITRDPRTGMRRSAAVESGAAARLQDRAIDPEQAAGTLEAAAQRYRQTGMISPDAFVLSRDPGLMAESRGQRAMDSARFMDRDMQAQQSISEAMSGLERGAAPAEAFPQFAISERARREEQISASVERAENAVDRATAAQRDLSTNFASRRTNQELASGRLQGEVLDNILYPMQAERKARYNMITNSPAARTMQIDPAPLRQALSDIQASQGALNVGSGVPSRQIAAIQQRLNSGQPITYRDVSMLRPELSAARSAAQIEGNVEMASNIDRLQTAVRQIDEGLANAAVRTTPDMEGMAAQSRMADLFGDDVNAAIAEVQRVRRRPAEGQTLSQFVRARGGISDDRGDVAAALGSQQRAASMLRQSGRSIDDLALEAWESGYFPGATRPTANEFLDALQGDLSGRPVRSQMDLDASAQAQDIDFMRQFFERNGVDWQETNPEVLRQQIADAFGPGKARPRSLDDLQAETRAMSESPIIRAAETEDQLRFAIREALNFDRERVFRYFGDPENRAGLAVREAANRGEFGPRDGSVRRGGESFARQYFLGAQTNPQEAARDLQQILSIAPNPDVGRQAARDYLIASAARSVGPSDNINPAVLERWMDQYRGALSEFPEVAREIRTVASDARAGRERQSQAAQDMRRVKEQARLSTREIEQGWIGLAIGGQGGNSPQNAARAILNSNNPREVTRQAMRDIEQFGNENVMQAFRNSVARHLADETRTSAIQQAGGADPVSYSAFIRRLRRADGAIEEIFKGDPRLQDLNNIRDALEDMQFVFARVNPGGSDTMQNLAERAISMAELPVRAQFGHLKGGGIMRTLRLYAQRVPGMDNSAAVMDLISEAAFNPELAAHLLRRPPDGNTRMAERQRTAWITRARTLYTGAQVSGRTGEEDNDRLQ